MNALYNKFQFWDGRVRTLEEQAALPIVNPIEMGQPILDAAVEAISEIPNIERPSKRHSGAHPMVPICCAQSRRTSARCFRSTRRSIAS